MDTSALLSTKLTPPRLRAALVTRPSLLARLDEGLDHKLTLLSAPAGFGKTTLVSEWLATRREREGAPAVAWVALDAGDNDPVRFWRYILTACQTFETELGRSALSLLHSAPQPPFEALLTGFINELTRLAGRAVLVVEDYHLITSPQIHEAMTFLLDHLPPSLHLIMLTRSDPPLPLARLRARGELNELNASDLRFSLTETQTFLHQALPGPLSAEVVERLNARTEGWAAGLRLVALTLQGQTGPASIEQFLDSFSGSHRPILEYLVEEVLALQPEPLQEFLLQTSVLIRLTGSLCEALTGRTDSAQVLEALERANLFLLPLDAAGQWYRYHALFAEAMQHSARHRLGEARLRALARTASDWYAAQELLFEAVESALSARAFDQAADLIERLVAPRLVQNEYHTLRRWLEQLPETTLRPRPSLGLIYAIAILFTSERYAPETFALLEPPLAMAEQQWRTEGHRAKLGEVLAFRALVAWFQRDLGHTFSAARQALELLPAENGQWRGISLIFVGLEELLNGRLNAARVLLRQALELSQRAGNIYAILDASLLLGRVYMEQGELRRATELYHQVLAQIEQAPMDRDLAQDRRGRALIGLSALELEGNALERAAQYAAEALAIEQSQADEALQIESALALAHTQHAQGEPALARQRLQALLPQIKSPLLLREIEAWQARFALVAGDLAAVRHWQAARLQPDDLPRLQQEQEALLIARLHLVRGEADLALRLLEGWPAEAETQGRVRSQIEIKVLLALAYAALADEAQARAMLIQALKLAQAGGYQRLFLNEGKPLATLLQAVLLEIRETAPRAYARRLLLAFSETPVQADGVAASLAAPLIEPLSAQEQRVLRLLAAGLSNPEIAEALVVSVNTVKTQVQSIYRKLDVHSREAAGDRAQQLKLL